MPTDASLRALKILRDGSQDYWWWNTRAPWLILVFGYLTFFVVSFWVYDMPSVRRKALTVGTIFAFDAVCLVVFAGVLKWI